MSDSSDRSEAPNRVPAPWLYLFGVLAWTWSWLGIAASSGRPIFSLPTAVLLLIGGLGPLVVPAILIRLGYWDPDLDVSVGAFFRRAYDPRSLSGRRYLCILGIIVVIALGPVLLDRWRPGGDGVGPADLVSAGSGGTLLIGILGGIVEEPGWRGYAQEGLQRRMPVLLASLVVGVFWALWHVPLFLIEGTYQAGLGWGTPAFWSFHLAIIAGCPLYAWLYNVAGGGGRSAGAAETLAGRATFATVLYHAGSNVGRELVPDVSNEWEVGVEAAVSLLVILVAWQIMRGARGGPSAGNHPYPSNLPTDSTSS